MNLFGFNLSLNRNSKIENRNSAPPPCTRSLSAFLRGDDADQTGTVLSNAYEQVVWVYRAINVLAEQVANIPFLFSSGERGRENLITSGPLLDFYGHPHPHINRFQYWELRIIWLMLRGECFRIPVFEHGKLVRILMLDPAHFQHIIRNHELAGWRYTGSGVTGPIASQVFLPEEVWFEKLPNPFNFWRGMPPLQVAALPAKTDFAAASFMRGLMENNADAGLIVRSDQQLGDEQRDQVIADLRDLIQGLPWLAHRTRAGFLMVM